MEVSKAKINVDDCMEVWNTSYGQKGVFAKRDFAVGESLGDDTTVLLPGTEDGWATMFWKNAHNLPPKQKECFLKYSYCIDFDGNTTGPLGPEYVDIVSYINHSCDPNVWYAENGDSYIARRPIIAGNICQFFYLINAKFKV